MPKGPQAIRSIKVKVLLVYEDGTNATLESPRCVKDPDACPVFFDNEVKYGVLAALQTIMRTFRKLKSEGIFKMVTNPIPPSMKPFSRN